MILGSAEVPRALARDYRTAPLGAADRTMLGYAVTLTRTPHAVTEADVQALAQVGFADAAILDICQVVAYFNYVNRLADGLGVEMEESWSEEDLTITREEFDRLVAERAEATLSEE